MNVNDFRRQRKKQEKIDLVKSVQQQQKKEQVPYPLWTMRSKQHFCLSIYLSLCRSLLRVYLYVVCGVFLILLRVLTYCHITSYGT